MFSSRIVALAQQIRLKEIAPSDVPRYDVDQVQECLLSEWIRGTVTPKLRKKDK